MRVTKLCALRSVVVSTLLIHVLVGGSLRAERVNEITCKDVDRIITLYFKNHLSVHNHSPKLSERAIDNFMKMLDPGKLYFQNSDVSELRAMAIPKVASQIPKGDCAFIDQIFAVYSKRFGAIAPVLHQLIDAGHDFSKDEYLDLNRKTMDYVSDFDTLKERWRKRIKFQMLQLKGTVDKIVTVRQKMHKRFELLEKRQRDLSIPEVREYFLSAFASALDPQSDYMSATQLEEFHIATRLSLEGIGAELKSEDGITEINKIVPGGAAAKAGTLKKGDKIIGVGQKPGEFVDVIDMELRDVVKKIRGQGGTRVYLQIKRKNETLVVDLIRKKVELPDRGAKSSVFHTEILPMPLDGQSKPAESKTYTIGLIHLPSFYIDFEGRQANQKDFRSSSKDVAREIEFLQSKNVDLIEMDLRGNGGGSLDEAVNLVGLFTGTGPVVQVLGKQSEPRPLASRGKALYQGPLVITIDQRSASASEIMAAAIQDFDRGLVLGNSHSFGKGSVQNVVDLENSLGALKVTISKFYRISGGSTQLKGVSPSVVLPGVMDLYEIGEKYYDFPLPWDQVPQLRYRAFGMVAPYIEKLQMASAARVKTDAGFLKIYKTMKDFTDKEKERYLISLKETKEKGGKKNLEEELEENLDDDTSKVFDIVNDIHLQEYLRVGTDYLRLLKGEDITRPEAVVISELASATALAAATPSRSAKAAAKKVSVK